VIRPTAGDAAGANRWNPLLRLRRAGVATGRGGAGGAVAVISVGSGCEGFTGTATAAGGKLGVTAAGAGPGTAAACGAVGTGGVGARWPAVGSSGPGRHRGR
jgi:hypothetical protein